VQRELGTIKRLFKKNEITAQLDNCEAELKAALTVFTVGWYLGTKTSLTFAFEDRIWSWDGKHSG
jgi:hypothetical protein